MAENTNIALTVEAWADIVIKEWLKKADALGVGNSEKSTGAALQSFTKTIFTNAQGDPDRVLFAFNWYLNMVDWGVGKNVTITNRESMIAAGLTKRRPKPFNSDTFYKQLEVLRHLLEEKHAMKIEQLVIEKLNS